MTIAGQSGLSSRISSVVPLKNMALALSGVLMTMVLESSGVYSDGIRSNGVLLRHPPRNDVTSWLTSAGSKSPTNATWA